MQFCLLLLLLLFRLVHGVTDHWRGTEGRAAGRRGDGAGGLQSGSGAGVRNTGLQSAGCWVPTTLHAYTCHMCMPVYVMCVVHGCICYVYVMCMPCVLCVPSCLHMYVMYSCVLCMATYVMCVVHACVCHMCCACLHMSLCVVHAYMCHCVLYMPAYVVCVVHACICHVCCACLHVIVCCTCLHM